MRAQWCVGAGPRAAFGLLALLLFSAAAAAPAGNPRPAEYCQAVEFPYYLYPRALWERELVWLKNIGIRTVEFSIPWNWHQLAPGDFDFTGRTSPRRDLHGLIRILRRLGLNAWVRVMPPVDGWRNLGSPEGAGCRRAASLVEAALRNFGNANRQPRRSGGFCGGRGTRYRRRSPARHGAHLRRQSGRAGAQPAGPRRRQERAVDRRGGSTLPSRLEKRRRCLADRGRGRLERR